jgi:autotransporter passenger strand-loop-strand repeat protein
VLGGSWMAVQSGGITSGTTVSSVLFVSGTASETQIDAGGTEFVSSGGIDIGATVSSGGVLNIGAGGTASGTVLSVGGGEIDAGRAVSTSVLGGSWMAVESGGVASDTMVSSLLFVLSGGVDVGAHINSGGLEVISAGGVASSAVIGGGHLEIAVGGSISGGVTFASSGGGVLQLDDSVHFGGLVAGFGQPDLIDLRDIAFGSATTLNFMEAQNNSSGTLLVSDGVNSSSITLLGQYVVGQFTSSSDGHNGTLIGDPPIVAQTDGAVAIVTGQHA